jgi:hypothetical protein
MREETTRYVFRVDRKDIAYLRSTIESYDGTAVVRTVDPSVALIEMMASPGCERTLEELVDHLVKAESLRLELVSGPGSFGGAPAHPESGDRS